jgi:hypothetical protein
VNAPLFKRVRIATVAVAVGCACSSAAQATPTLSLTPSFAETARLREATSLSINLGIRGTEYDGFPDPLRTLTIGLPTSTTLSGEGFAVCSKEVLETVGPSGCPSASVAGATGIFTAIVSFGSERVEEQGTVEAFFSSSNTMSLFFDGHTPVSLEILATGSLFASSAPFGPSLRFLVPFVSTVPGAPYASLTNVTVNLGSHQEALGSLLNSILAPTECVEGHLHWQAEAGFSDESTSPETTAHAAAETACLAASAPKVGQRQAVGLTSGTVLVRVKGSSNFVPLTGTTVLPNGSEVEATHGSLTVTAATPTPGRLQTAELHGGRFVIAQEDNRNAVTHFDLSLALTGCAQPAFTRQSPAAALSISHPRPRSRHLWVSERGGKWATDGRYVSTVVQGTHWLTQDECGKSEVAVVQGKVLVRNLITNKTALLRAGQRYTAGPLPHRR